MTLCRTRDRGAAGDVLPAAHEFTRHSDELRRAVDAFGAGRAATVNRK